jgi:hypothetical protein
MQGAEVKTLIPKHIESLWSKQFALKALEWCDVMCAK